jgi:hypothetical protein
VSAAPGITLTHDGATESPITSVFQMLGLFKPALQNAPPKSTETNCIVIDKGLYYIAEEVEKLHV